MGLTLRVGHREAPPEEGRRGMMEWETEGSGWQRLRLTGPALGSQAAGGLTVGIENRQLDPLGQLLSSGGGSSHPGRYQSGGAGLQEG